MRVSVGGQLRRHQSIHETRTPPPCTPGHASPIRGVQRRGVTEGSDPWYGLVLWLCVVLFLPIEAAGKTLLYPLEHGPAVSSTFGTYRIARHHAGLDLVTGGDDTVPVLAAAAGRVIRIRRSQSGLSSLLLCDPSFFVKLALAA